MVTKKQLKIYDCILLGQGEDFHPIKIAYMRNMCVITDYPVISMIRITLTINNYYNNIERIL